MYSAIAVPWYNIFVQTSRRRTWKEAGSAIGGLSVTGCLADFSVYIFHPYGGGKKTGLKEAQWSPLSDSERKDSLSINVAFVKFHMSRSRKLNFQSEQLKKISDTSRAVIRFSSMYYFLITQIIINILIKLIKYFYSNF